MHLNALQIRNVLRMCWGRNNTHSGKKQHASLTTQAASVRGRWGRWAPTSSVGGGCTPPATTHRPAMKPHNLRGGGRHQETLHGAQRSGLHAASASPGFRVCVVPPKIPHDRIHGHDVAESRLVCHWIIARGHRTVLGPKEHAHKALLERTRPASCSGHCCLSCRWGGFLTFPLQLGESRPVGAGGTAIAWRQP